MNDSENLYSTLFYFILVHFIPFHFILFHLFFYFILFFCLTYFILLYYYILSYFNDFSTFIFHSYEPRGLAGNESDRASAIRAVLHILIRAIITVSPQITRQHERNTLATSAAELIHGTPQRSHGPNLTTDSIGQHGSIAEARTNRRGAIFRGITYFTAAAVGGEARVQSTIFTGTGDGDDAHRLAAEVLANFHHILAGVLVGRDDGAHYPVGPVDVVAVDGQCERVAHVVP